MQGADQRSGTRLLAGGSARQLALGSGQVRSAADPRFRRPGLPDRARVPTARQVRICEQVSGLTAHSAMEGLAPFAVAHKAADWQAQFLAQRPAQRAHCALASPPPSPALSWWLPRGSEAAVRSYRFSSVWALPADSDAHR